MPLQSILDQLNQIFADNVILQVALSGFGIVLIGAIFALVRRKKSSGTNNGSGDNISVTIGDNNQNVAAGKNVRQIIKQYFEGDGDERKELRNRQTMLQLVKTFWVEGVLEQSLYQEVLIELGIEHKPNAVENPWNSVIQEAGQATRTIEPDTKISNVFRQMNESLVILGSPGSGKTNLLLQLARDLINQTEVNIDLPLPVVFNLSSWSDKRESISAWLVDELRQKYSIPKKLAELWVENDDLLLLLDGLDEVDARFRDECVTRINEFRDNHFVPFAICSRIEEFESLTEQLNAQGAIVIQSLNEEQIHAYLEDVGLEQKLGKVIQQDSNLLEVADSPLMLNVMALAYDEKAVDELNEVNTVDGHRKNIFDSYIKRMFARRSDEQAYTPQQTVHYLRWLAGRMVEHAQTVFLIERLQPSWAHTAKYSRLTTTLAMSMWGLVYGFIFTLPTMLVFALALGLISAGFLGLLVTPEVGLMTGLYMGGNTGILFGWTSFWLMGIENFHIGVVLGLLGMLVDTITGKLGIIDMGDRFAAQWGRIKSSLYSTLFWGLAYGLLAGVASGISGGLLIFSITGLLGAIVGSFRQIQFANPSHISWRRVRYSTYSGLLIGLILWLISLLTSLLLYGHNDGIGMILVLGMVFGIFFGPIKGFFFQRRTTIETIRPTTSLVSRNVWSSAKVALIASLIFGLLGAGLLGVQLALDTDNYSEQTQVFVNELSEEDIEYLGKGNVHLFRAFWSGIAGSIWGGAIGGIVGGFIGGGDFVVKYGLLYFILWLKGTIPLNYAKFLNHATERIFLRKVGGGYIFIHRTLMEHFASLTDADIKKIVGPEQQSQT